MFLLLVILSTLLWTGLAQESIYGDNGSVGLSSTGQQIIVAVLSILLFVFMLMDITGPEVVFLCALMIVTLTQVITLQDALSGFSNESMITIGTLFLVVGAVDRSHVVDWLARKTFGTDGSIIYGKLRLYIACFCLSIFFNNTPLVAILMPVVKDWGRMRGVAASQLLIPLSYSVLAGSFVSMIGTSTNLTVQGLMQADRGYSFEFFAPAPFGIACFGALLPYLLICGPYILPSDRSGLFREARDKAETLIAEVFISEHSLAIGKSLGEMMSSIGVAPTAAIKIRRKIRDKRSDVHTDQASMPITPSRSSLILDSDYIKQQADFWLRRREIPDRVDQYHRPGGAEEGLDNNVDLEARNIDPEQNHSEFHDIIAPSAHEPICADDVVFISSAQDTVEKMMKSIMGESRGMYILRSNVMALPGFGTEVVELVISDTNPFLGRKVSDISAEFSEKYSVGLITVRAKDWNVTNDEEEEEISESQSEGSRDNQQVAIKRIPSEDHDIGLELVDQESPRPVTLDGYQAHESVEGIAGEHSDAEKSSKEILPHNRHHHKVSISDHVLNYGDCVLVVTNKKQVDKLSHNRDFFVVSAVGNLPKPLTFYRLIPVLIFVVMLVLVALELISMCPAALTVTAIYFVGGWIKAEDIPEMVNIRLLMLMGCSLSYAVSMTKSGLAVEIASAITSANPTPQAALLLIYAITLVITELISNNAAAALMYPIAVALADELEVSFKPFAMTVLLSATSCFMSPIGYQTHTMVWGPGGYRFRDFLSFGFVPDIIYWLIACSLIPAVFPFNE